MAWVTLKVTPQLLYRKTQTSSCFPGPQLQSACSRFPRKSSAQSLSLNAVRSSRCSVVSRAAVRSSRCSVVSRAASFDTGNIVDDLDQVSMFTASGESVMLKDLLGQNEEIAVVSLLRHFGCPCCWELASALKEAKARFDSADVKLIAIGVGGPDKARILAERLPFPMECLYADPERKAYDVLGLYHGFGRTFFNPASAKVLSRFESLKEAVKNYTIEATPDDRSGVLQQGGMFVFKGNELIYSHKDEGTGDHASLDDIFDICCRVPVT